jgi:hypothetical protein
MHQAREGRDRGSRSRIWTQTAWFEDEEASREEEVREGR